MLAFLNRFRRRSTISIGHPDDWRIVVDFTGTMRASPRAAIVSDLEPDELGAWLRYVASGTLVVLSGLEVLPMAAEDVALLVARASRRADAVDIFCDCDAAEARWRQRFIGNLARFGCIELGEAISELPPATNGPRTGVP